MSKKITKQILFTLSLLMMVCCLSSPMKAKAASKPVSKVYCCLYTNGNLVVSQKRIVPQRGRRVLENKRVARPSDLINKREVTSIQFKGMVKPKNCSLYFAGMTKVTTFKNMKNFNTSAATNMSGMFATCNKLTRLNLSHFSTKSAKRMTKMFYSCIRLSRLDVSTFNTKKVQKMNYMFAYCHNLKSLNVRKLNTAKVTSMEGMFAGCQKLTSLNVSNFNTSNVQDMSSMFAECAKLKTLNLRNFDTAKVTDMKYMFNGTSALSTLNLSNFNTSHVTGMRAMFFDCRRLKSLDIRNFTFDKTKSSLSYMFYNVPSKVTVIVTQKGKDTLCGSQKAYARAIKHWKIVESSQAAAN